MPVAQAVEHLGKQLPGGGDLGDVPRLLAAAGDDRVLGLRGRVPAGWCWIASISAQRRPRALLGTWPRITLVSDSWCRGVSPAHEHSWAGCGTG